MSTYQTGQSCPPVKLWACLVPDTWAASHTIQSKSRYHQSTQHTCKRKKVKESSGKWTKKWIAMYCLWLKGCSNGLMTHRMHTMAMQKYCWWTATCDCIEVPFRGSVGPSLTSKKAGEWTKHIFLLMNNDPFLLCPRADLKSWSGGSIWPRSHQRGSCRPIQLNFVDSNWAQWLSGKNYSTIWDFFVKICSYGLCLLDNCKGERPLLTWQPRCLGLTGLFWSFNPVQWHYSNMVEK